MSLHVSSEGLPLCEESWDSSAKAVYGTFTNITQVRLGKDDILDLLVLLQFVLPFLTIIICYVQIGRRISQRQTSTVNRFRS